MNVLCGIMLPSFFGYRQTLKRIKSSKQSGSRCIQYTALRNTQTICTAVTNILGRVAGIPTWVWVSSLLSQIFDLLSLFCEILSWNINKNFVPSVCVKKEKRLHLQYKKWMKWKREVLRCESCFYQGINECNRCLEHFLFLEASSIKASNTQFTPANKSRTKTGGNVLVYLSLGIL